MTDAARGVAAMVGACLIWGLSPIYFKALAHVPPLELLSHRTLWSALFFLGVLALQRRLGVLGAALGSPAGAARILAAALAIATNWFIFIFAIQAGRATEASLGYYIFPLVAVVIGVFAFGERPRPAQWGAVALAALAVLVLTWGQGAAPWIALCLSVSFGLYGLAKKRLAVGPVVSVTGEVLLLSPLALLVLGLVHGGLWPLGVPGQAGHFGGDTATTLLLAAAGPITATPLILFSYATRRISLGTVGLVQYLNPTLQFTVAVVIFAEPFGPFHAIAFPLIWTALALYTASALRAEKAARRASMAAAAVGAVPMNARSEGSAKP